MNAVLLQLLSIYRMCEFMNKNEIKQTSYHLLHIEKMVISQIENFLPHKIENVHKISYVVKQFDKIERHNYNLNIWTLKILTFFSVGVEFIVRMTYSNAIR